MDSNETKTKISIFVSRGVMKSSTAEKFWFEFWTPEDNIQSWRRRLTYQWVHYENMLATSTKKGLRICHTKSFIRDWIQFNSKTLFKDGDPVNLKLIFTGAIQTWKQIQQVFIQIYKTKQVHQKITDKHNLHFHTKH